MKKNTVEIKTAFAAVTAFMRDIENKIVIPVIIDGFTPADYDSTQLQIALTAGASVTSSPLNIVINIEDEKLIERAKTIFSYPTFRCSLVDLVNRVCFEQKIGTRNEPITTEQMLDRWERYILWINKHYPKYETDSDWYFRSPHPDNYAAWAARVILGNVQPGEYTKKLIRDRKVEFGEDGYVRLLKPIALYNFKEDAVQSVGATGMKRLTGGDFKCCFTGPDSRLAYCTKVPEQWEIDEGVFVEFKVDKPSFIERIVG